MRNQRWFYATMIQVFYVGGGGNDIRSCRESLEKRREITIDGLTADGQVGAFTGIVPSLIFLTQTTGHVLAGHDAECPTSRRNCRHLKRSQGLRSIMTPRAWNTKDGLPRYWTRLRVFVLIAAVAALVAAVVHLGFYEG